jgi:hypothetical protein
MNIQVRNSVPSLFHCIGLCPHVRMTRMPCRRWHYNFVDLMYIRREIRPIVPTKEQRQLLYSNVIESKRYDLHLICVHLDLIPVCLMVFYAHVPQRRQH